MGEARGFQVSKVFGHTWIPGDPGVEKFEFEKFSYRTSISRRAGRPLRPKIANCREEAVP